MTIENNLHMDMKLLKEAIWNIEDKLNVILKSIAEHESELTKLRQTTNLCLERLTHLKDKKRRRNNKRL